MDDNNTILGPDFGRKVAVGVMPALVVGGALAMIAYYAAPKSNRGIYMALGFGIGAWGYRTLTKGTTA